MAMTECLKLRDSAEHRSALIAFLLSFGLAAAACAPEAGPAQRWSSSDSAGVSLLVYSGPADTLLGKWHETLVLSGNALEVAGITDASLGTGGTVAILDHRSPRVLLVGQAEDPVPFGHRGEGPGELRLPVSVTTSNRTIHVFDRRRQRLISFDDTGRFLGEADVGPDLSLLAVPLGARRALSVRLSLGRSTDATVEAATLIESTAVLEVVDEGGERITLLRRAGPPEVLVGSTSLPVPATPRPILEARPGGGGVFASGVEPEIVFIDDDGRVERVFRWPSSRQELTPEHWDSLHDEVTATARPGGLGLVDAMFDEAFRPAHLPWAYAVAPASDEKVWLQASTVENDPSRRVYCIDLRERSIRRGFLPRPGRLMAARGDTLVVRTADDLGVHSLRWYSLNRPDPGP